MKRNYTGKLDDLDYRSNDQLIGITWPCKMKIPQENVTKVIFKGYKKNNELRIIYYIDVCNLLI